MILKTLWYRLTYKPNWFRNHDLNKWNYLGYSEISYSNPGESKPWAQVNVHFFQNKNDHNIRSWSLGIPSSKYVDFKNHTFLEFAEQWRIGEEAFYKPIAHPSKYLKDQMWDIFKYVWSDKETWWVRNDQTKYEQAVKENNSKKELPSKTETDNIVKIEFGKK